LLASGEKLRELLQKHGNFQQVEVELSKWSKRVQSDGKSGKWVTKAYLVDICNYSKKFDGNYI
jgi:hypothetical protein